MNPLRTLLLVSTLFVGSFALPALGEEPWETAAVKGIQTMNLGDGREFIKVAHTETKTRMRKFLLDRLRGTPGSRETQATLQEMGVSSLDEAEKIPLDPFVQQMIVFMHAAAPQPQRQAMEEAQFRAVSSEPSGDSFRVTVEMTYVAGGTTRTAKMPLLARREGSEWKYNGDTK